MASTYVGYLRVSTDDQTFALQRDALQAVGCTKFYDDVASGAKTDRPGLTKALEYLRDGDTLVVWKLDRLGRSLQQLIALISMLRDRGIAFKSLTEEIDTTTPQGKLFFHFFAALAEFERDLIRERTKAGLAAARARGRKGGRRRKLSVEELQLVHKLYSEKEQSVSEICRMLKIGRTTLYRYLQLPPAKITFRGHTHVVRNR